MSENSVVVKVVDNMIEAELIKAKLQSEDVPCTLKYEAIGRIMNLTMNGLGKIEILVPSEFKKEAEEIIEDVH